MKISTLQSLRKKILIASSLIVSSALVFVIFAAVHGYLQVEELLTPFLRVILIAFACGVLTGVLWGRSNLDGIYPVLYPGGAILALFIFALPIGLFGDYFQNGRLTVLESSETIINLVGMYSALLSVTFFPLLGPVLAHAYWNARSWPQIKQDLRDVMKAFKESFIPRQKMPWEP